MPSQPKDSYFHRGIWQRQSFVFCLLVLFVCQSEAAEKIRYALDTECDRYSLDAVYHEKFKPSTTGIFEESQSLVNQVSDLVAESLIAVMADLPDRDQSSNEERKIFGQFKALKTAFGSKLKKIQRNITSSWEFLMVDHFDLMFDNGKTSLQVHLNNTLNMTESYNQARKSLDTNMGSFVTFIKSTLLDGVQGIRAAAQEAHIKEVAEKKKKKEEEEDGENEQKNDTKSSDDSQEGETKKEESKEEFLQRKQLEIAEMIVPGFLGKLTMEVIRRNIDLSGKEETSIEERESPLDDIIFDVLIIRNRIRAIIQPDMPTDKGSVDLARRSIYTYWAGMASDMYKEKMLEKQEEKKTDQKESSEEKQKEKKSDDNDALVEKLLDLMEKYP